MSGPVANASDAFPSQGDPYLRPAVAARSAALGAVAIILSAAFFAYRSTLLELARTWMASDSYAHGWLILPISLYLAWRQRAVLASTAVNASAAGLMAAAGAVAMWLFGGVANALVLQGLAVIALPAAIIWTVCGAAWARRLSFPCAYLVFAVPFGEPLVEPLMEWTASATVAMLRATGIPVFRDGMLFSTSVGDFEVARACSGIRYLMASAAIGILYGYLVLRTPARRWTFAALALLAPVLANALRAYGIVVLAHLTDMRLAVGVDHFVYGWFFFGIVMFCLFWIGHRLRKGEGDAVDPPPRPVAESSRTRVAGFAMASSFIVLAGPVLAKGLDRRIGVEAAGPGGLPIATAPWRGPLESTGAWRPSFRGEPRITQADYENAAGERVTVTLVHYAVESQGAELVGDVNALADTARWRFVEGGSTAVEGIAVRSSRFRSLHARSELTLWWLYALNGEAFVWPSAVKLAGAFERLRERPRAPVLVLLSHAHGEAHGSRTALESFALAHLASVLACAAGDLPASSGCEP